MTQRLDDPVVALLREFPLTSKWLDEVIDVLLYRAPNGVAHVRDMACELWKTHDIDSIEEAITRRINDFCSNAADFDKPAAYDLFERVKPATYRLRSYPNRPDTLELISVRFEDATVQGVWETFSAAAKKKVATWHSLTNREKLRAFAKNMEHGKRFRIEYQKRLAALHEALKAEDRRFLGAVEQAHKK